MSCRICLKDVKTRNINLYVYGSEALDVCHKCEMEIVELVRVLIKTAALERKRKYIKKKRLTTIENKGGGIKWQSLQKS